MGENLHLNSSEVWNETPISPQEIKRDMHICITVASGQSRPAPTCGTVLTAQKTNAAMVVAIEIAPNAPRVFTLLDQPPADTSYTVVQRTLNKPS